MYVSLLSQTYMNVRTREASFSLSVKSGGSGPNGINFYIKAGTLGSKDPHWSVSNSVTYNSDPALDWKCRQLGLVLISIDTLFHWCMDLYAVVGKAYFLHGLNSATTD